MPGAPRRRWRARSTARGRRSRRRSGAARPSAACATCSSTPRAPSSSSTRARVHRNRDPRSSSSADTVPADRAVGGDGHGRLLDAHRRRFGTIGRMRIVSPPAVDDGDPVRDRRRRRGRRGDLRVRPPRPRPASARIVSTSALPEGLVAAEIDAFVSAAMRAGEDLYHLDEGALSGPRRRPRGHPGPLRRLRGRRLGRRRRPGPPRLPADVLTIDPHTLDEVLGLGPHPRRGHRPRGEARGAGRRRCAAGSTPVRARGRGRARAPAPAGAAARVDRPAFAPGHWVPEMVDASPAAYHRRRRRGEVGPGDLGAGARRAPPDVVVCAPCGYDLDGSPALARKPSSTPACCQPASRSGRWTPTRPSRARGPASWTGSRRWRASSTQRSDRRLREAARQLRG